MKTEAVQIPLLSSGTRPPPVQAVRGVWLSPSQARAALVLAHGAGAGMNHAFMESIALALAEGGIATLRYQFPYFERGRRAPDRPPVLTQTVRSAVGAARSLSGALPLLAGGKSMGGRMTSLAMSEAPLDSVQGLVFFGFPLHAAGRPSVDRAAHLAGVGVPMLFLQGTRDKLADLERLRPVCVDLGPGARLHIVEGADHGFHVLKRSGRTDDEVVAELAKATVDFAAVIAAERGETGG